MSFHDDGMPQHVFGIAAPAGVLSFAWLGLTDLVFCHELFEATASADPLGGFVLGEGLDAYACQLVEVGQEDSFCRCGVEADCLHGVTVLGFVLL